MTAIKTAVGIVDKEALNKLQEDFDTRRIMDAVSDLDELRGEIEEPGGPRTDFFRLHEMLMYLCDEDAPPGGEEAVWELVEELSHKFSNCRDLVEKITDLLDELQKLCPDPDEEEGAEDFDGADDDE